MRNVNFHQYQVSQWLQPSRGSIMHSNGLPQRKSYLQRSWIWATLVLALIAAVWGWGF